MHCEDYGVRDVLYVKSHVEIKWVQLKSPSLTSWGESHRTMTRKIASGSRCHKGIVSKFLVFSTKTATELLQGDRQRPAASLSPAKASGLRSPCQPCPSHFYGMAFPRDSQVRLLRAATSEQQRLLTAQLSNRVNFLWVIITFHTLKTLDFKMLSPSTSGFIKLKILY